ncbi:MAG: SsrA-binding protein, partial [Thermoplasmatota archaeon]
PHQHAPTRVRTLLAHKRQIAKLARAAEAKGMTIVPLKLYFKSGFAKLLIGLARGKATHDKRHAIAERDAERIPVHVLVGRRGSRGRRGAAAALREPVDGALQRARRERRDPPQRLALWCLVDLRPCRSVRVDLDPRRRRWARLPATPIRS